MTNILPSTLGHPPSHAFVKYACPPPFIPRSRDGRAIPSGIKIPVVRLKEEAPVSCGVIGYEGTRSSPLPRCK